MGDDRWDGGTRTYDSPDERPQHRSTIVVVGASLAGLRAAEEVRHEGHAGPVVIVGEELHAPYDRPPLSKQVLAGNWDVERIHHHAPDKLDTLGLEFRLGRRALSLDTGRADAALRRRAPSSTTTG